MMETGLVAIEVVSKIHSVNIDMAAVKRRYFIEDIEQCRSLAHFAGSWYPLTIEEAENC